MKKWILKAVVQKGISFLPFKHQLNYLFQRYVTRGVFLTDSYLEDRLIHFKHHHRFFLDFIGPFQGISLLELGTGWYPVIPVCSFLAGAGEINTVDISRLTDRKKLLHTAERLIQLATSRQLADYFDPDPNRLAALQALTAHPPGSLEACLEALGIRYLVGDARRLPLPNSSQDLLLSNNTFEHIYPSVLESILREFKRLQKKRGMMSHFIDMSDHFAHLDPGITIYNFLRFSKSQWSWIDNSIQPQNRLRLPDYRLLYERLRIPVTKEFNRPGDLKALATIPIHPDFGWMSLDQLAVSHSYVVSVNS